MSRTYEQLEPVIGALDERIKKTGDEISELKEDLTKKIEIENIGGSPVVYNSIANEYVAMDGSFASYNNWSRSDYIPVTGGEKLYYYTDTICAYNIFYDENKAKIGNNVIMYDGLYSEGNYRYVAVPQGAKYFAFSNSTSAFKGTKLWRANALIDDSAPSTLKTYSSEKINALVSGQPEIVLPKDVYAVVGTEFNIYYENVIICDNINDYYIYPFLYPYVGVTYNTYSDRFQFVPTADNIGDYQLRISLKSKHDWSTICTVTIALHVISNTSLTGKKVIFIGDSLTNAGYYPYEIEKVLSANGVISLGTQISSPWIDNVQQPINHEGRGGWAAYDYTERASWDEIVNAFWNPSANKFDFSYYMTQQGYTRPDIIFLNLGTNGAGYVNRTVAAISEMITSIHAYDDTIPICVSLITPPATQNGWTYVAPGGSAGQFAVEQMALIKRYLAEYDGVINNVYVSPVYFNLDRYHDYNTAEFPASARNPEIVIRQTNNVHPSKYGYLKFADVYWAMIEHLLT